MTTDPVCLEVDELLDRQGFFPWMPIQLQPANVSAVPKFSGVYVLHLQDGAYYAGQAKNIAVRLRQHLHDQRKVVAIRGLRVKPASLEVMEQELIWTLEGIGAPLHNIRGTGWTVKQMPFDDNVMSPDLQQKWLNDLSFRDDQDSRQWDQLQREKYQGRYQLWQRLPLVPLAKDLLKTYIPRLIPAVWRTEGKTWNLSCTLPSSTDAGFCRINIDGQEVFAVADIDGGIPLIYFMIPAISLRPLLSELSQELKSMNVNEDRWWESGGPDQGTVRFKNPADVKKFLQVDQILMSIRRFNLNLARRGPSRWYRSHCPQALDHVKTVYRITRGPGLNT